MNEFGSEYSREKGARAREGTPDYEQMLVDAQRPVAAERATADSQLVGPRAGEVAAVAERQHKALAAVERAHGIHEVKNNPLIVLEGSDVPPAGERYDAFKEAAFDLNNAAYKLEQGESGVAELTAIVGDEAATMALARRFYDRVGRHQEPFAVREDVMMGKGRTVCEIAYRTEDPRVVVVENWDGVTGALVESMAVKCDDPVAVDREGREALSDKVWSEYANSGTENKDKILSKMWPQGRPYPDRGETTVQFHQRLMELGMPMEAAYAIKLRELTAQEAVGRMSEEAKMDIRAGVGAMGDAFVQLGRDARDLWRSVRTERQQGQAGRSVETKAQGKPAEGFWQRRFRSWLGLGR